MRAIEVLTQEERDDVEDLPRRQPGCPDKDCSACRANTRRADALAKLLRMHDEFVSRVAELEQELADVRGEMRTLDGGNT